ncbi:hypothetical protein BN1708_019198, partial [Verticillium longisporum]
SYAHGPDVSCHS